ncbi:MAG: mechanosensitive ion channel [Anaerolineae bacterium]|nr:mechanosensitive ion channel [Anaerolineae bacterium]
MGWVLGRINTRLIYRLLDRTTLNEKLAGWFGQSDSIRLNAWFASINRLLFFLIGLWAAWQFVSPIEEIQGFTQSAGEWIAKFFNLPIVVFVFNLAVVVLATFLLFRVISWIRIGFERFEKNIKEQRGTSIKKISIQKLQLLSADQLTNFVLSINKYGRFLVNILVILIYLSGVFSIFPQTRGIVTSILEGILGVIAGWWQNFVGYLPSLFNLIIIILATNYLLKFLHFIFREIGKGTITFANFDPDWSEPTYQLVRFLVIALALVVAFPFLPGSSSPVFQGVSIFVGFLFSFGSSSIVANVIAGVVMTYTRAFKVGDRVKIADTVGDVIEKTLLVTRIRTIKNVDITVPNGMVLGSHIINYSSVAQERGLILNTTITLGYVVPWRLVHETLIKAALVTSNIQEKPKPFVYQTSLDDYYVSYELNAYTNLPSDMAKIYSDLHQNIQDKFNEAGIEILSPHYQAARDGSHSTIPVEYLPKDYQAPPFHVSVRKEK